MQVLLRENVPRVGNCGDIVEVKDGYARNFLLPKGIAIAVRRSDLAVIEAERKRLAKTAEVQRLESEELMAKLTESSVTIVARANEEGHLFGSVGAAEIAKALSDEVTPVDESAVKLEEHIKELGVYDVIIHVSAQHEATVKVWVIGEQ